MIKTNNICYTGLHSVKSGNYTKKKYLETMNKKFKKDCSVYIKSLKCKSCQTNMKINSNVENLIKQLNKCKRCKNNKTKKCNLKNYLLFSGAELGKCKK